ncbi:MAG TPA: hypothetical protein VM120_07120 [Bryobacteraceae bacterium]|nr:hypothetical protein [Bryobacteraceae bacterium]
MRLLAGLLYFCFLSAAADPQRNIYTGLLDEVVPQVANGDGWRTAITLVNVDDKLAAFTLSFFDPDGKPMLMTLVGQQMAASKFNGTIPVSGSITLQTDGNGPLRQGWAKAESGQRISGLAVFGSTDPASGRTQEAVVPLSSWSDTDFYMPFDNSNGFQTSMSICHPEPLSFASSTTLTLAFFSETGTRIYLDQITLRPGQRLAFATVERWPQIAGRRGTVHVTSAGLFLSVLGLRFNPGGSFTSIHTLSR